MLSRTEGIYVGICFSFISIYLGYVAIFDRPKSFVSSEQIDNIEQYILVKKELSNEVGLLIGGATNNKSKLTPDSLVNKCLEYEFDLTFALAQGWIESHFGVHGMASKTKSVWNVYAFDNVSYNKIHKNGKYLTADDCIEPYLQLLKTSYLVNKTEKDLMYSFVNKHNKRYASDPNYEVNLRCKIKYIEKSTRIPQLYDSLKLIKDRLIDSDLISLIEHNG